MASSRRDGLASFLGIVVFLVGVGLIGAMFWQAWLMFSTAPAQNLGLKSGKPIDFAVVMAQMGRLIIQILLLVVMTGIGSALANRGVKMYASGRSVEGDVTKGPSGDPAE
jgi:hypothetical protein